MIMDTASLIKMTLGVALATVAAFKSNANELTSTVTSVVDAPIIESNSSLLKLDFTELLAQFDINKDGALSEAELSASDNEALKSAFNDFDVNNDANINAEEFSTFEGVSID